MIAAEIRKLVALFTCEIPPDVCGFASITEVEVSSDLSYATVYVSAFEKAQGAVRFLADNKGELKRRLSKVILGYKLPELRFNVDTRSDRANRIDELLAKTVVAEPAMPKKRMTRKTKKS